MKTFEPPPGEVVELCQATVWEGLDLMGIGLFRLNDEGCLIQINNAARGILGIDDTQGCEKLHISKVDHILGSGLADQLDSILHDSTAFVRRNLRCTNSHGRFMVLNLCCIPISSTKPEDREVLGIVEDCINGHRDAASEINVRRQLSILSEVAAALSSSSELPQILKIILTGATASQGLCFNRAFLFLYDEQKNRLRGHMAVGPSSPDEAGDIWRQLDSMRMTLGELLDTHQGKADNKSDAVTSLITGLSIDLNEESVIRSTCQRGSWINLGNVPQIDPVTTTFIERLKTSRIALVPMVSKGSLRGLLAADNYITGQPISDDAVRLLQILANQAAVAMERAKLYDNERERAQQLQRTNALLAESQDQIIRIEKMSVIGELTSAVAHELRNPLTIIGGFANLLLKSPLSDEHREYLNIISSEIKRTESVLNHVLDFSLASRNENQLIDFSQLSERSLQLLLGRRQQTDISISLSLAHEKLMVYGNCDQLSHAIYQFLKLIAEDVIPPGTAEVRTEREKAQACLWVRVSCPDSTRDKTIKTLRQTLTSNKTSQRLTVLVAAETIKLHGGEYGVALGNDGLPSLYVKLPLTTEDEGEPTHLDR